MGEKLDQHEMINKLKDIVIELGRVPNAFEFESKSGISNHAMRKAFGTYTALVLAAGFEAYQERRRLTNQIFERSLPEVLLEHKPSEIIAQSVYDPTLVIGDLHFPFVNQIVLEAIYEWASKRKKLIKRIVQVGDLYDQYCSSKFPRSLNSYSPEEEERLARAGAEKMWATLRSLCPNAECVQLKGNHDIRALKRTLESAPSVEHIVAKHLDQLMSFDGVKLIVDPRQEYIVDGIQFIHGYRSKLGDHANYAHMHTVCGHSHVGGVQFKRIRGQTLWELNVGYVGDPESKALGYTSQRITNWTPGFGYIDENGPRFIAL